MLVSLKWLSQYVDIDSLPAEELAEKITRAGIEVDAVIDRSQGIKNVVVGHVVSKEKHPEADKLNVCQVDVGEEELQQKCFVFVNVGIQKIRTSITLEPKNESRIL